MGFEREKAKTRRTQEHHCRTEVIYLLWGTSRTRDAFLEGRDPKALLYWGIHHHTSEQPSPPRHMPCRQPSSTSISLTESYWIWEHVIQWPCRWQKSNSVLETPGPSCAEQLLPVSAPPRGTWHKFCNRQRGDSQKHTTAILGRTSAIS